MLKFTNLDKTYANFNGASFSLASPEDWESIGDTPTREAVLAWLAAGNIPEPADMPNPNDVIVAQIADLERNAMIPRVTREFMLAIALKEGLAAGYTEAQLIAVNIGYAKVKELDDQINALRAQLV